jgi:hypothetical protein
MYAIKWRGWVLAAYVARGNARFSHRREPAWARQVSMGSSTRFHAPRTLCRWPVLHVIGLEHMLSHCRGQGLILWLAGDDIAGREDEGGWVLRAK